MKKKNILAKKLLDTGKSMWKEHGKEVVDKVKGVVESKIDDLADNILSSKKGGGVSKIANLVSQADATKKGKDSKDNALTNKVLAKGMELLDSKKDDIVGMAKNVVVTKIDGLTTGLLPEEDADNMSTGNGQLSDSSLEEVKTLPVIKEAPSEETPCQDVVSVDEDVETPEVIAEDDMFQNGMDKLSSSLSAAAANGFTNPQDITNALSALTEVANDTVKYVAEQETKQVEINAKRDVALAQINATTACIKEYLDKTFDERSAIFAKQFACVDEALRKGDNEMLALSLNSINSLAASSPFKNLADIGQVQQSLMSGEEEWDI